MSVRKCSHGVAPLLLALLLVPPAAGARAPRQPAAELRAPVASAAAPNAALTLVLPFRAVGATDPDWLAEGAARFIDEALRATGAPTVAADDRHDALEAMGLAGEARLTTATACTLARQLHARRVVLGTWTSDGTRLSFTARMLDAEKLHLIAESKSSGHASAIGNLLGSVAMELAGGAARTGDARGVIERLSGEMPVALQEWMQAAPDDDAAAQHLQAALDADAAFLPARLDLAELRLDAGVPAEAAKLLAAAPGDAPASQRQRTLVLLGRAQLAAHDVGRAIGTLTEAVRLVSDRAALTWLAEAQLAGGDREGARQTARRLLELAPDDARAKEVLDGGATPGASGPRSQALASPATASSVPTAAPRAAAVGPSDGGSTTPRQE